jgi:hypothetical protein
MEVCWDRADGCRATNPRRSASFEQLMMSGIRYHDAQLVRLLRNITGCGMVWFGLGSSTSLRDRNGNQNIGRNASVIPVIRTRVRPNTRCAVCQVRCGGSDNITWVDKFAIWWLRLHSVLFHLYHLTRMFSPDSLSSMSPISIAFCSRSTGLTHVVLR